MCIKFLSDNSDTIQSAAAIATVVVGVVGFYYLWDQLSQTKAQISQTKEIFQASNTYEIQKDVRALVGELKNEKLFREALRDGISNKNKTVFLENLWIMLNFYLSVFRQNEMGGVTQSFIDSFKNDFCGFVKLSSVEEGWNELMRMNRLSQAHDKMRSIWCETS
ncbi:MAG: hypothetical protein QF754_00420 [Alphaproteobacteria bacterium]|nr:hypothetical protein [Alphaproteobacteria bacterium]